MEQNNSIHVGMLGHATMLIETQSMVCLTDPVMGDTFHEALFRIYPARRLDTDKLPRLDLIFLSHRHFDHFDIHSLKRLPTDVPVIIPDDGLLASVLGRLGFSQVSRIQDWGEHWVGNTRLTFTPSRLKVPEVGLLVQHGEASFWNQVDSDVDPETVRRVQSACGRVSFLLGPWQPSFEAPLQYNTPAVFPNAGYATLLQKAAVVRPLSFAPGACGFSHGDGHEWQNRLSFPVTRERFMRDLGEMTGLSPQHVFALDPGDAVWIGPDGATRDPAGVACVTHRESWDSSQLRFSPVLPLYGLDGAGPAGAGLNSGRVKAFIDDLQARLEAHWLTEEGVSALRRNQQWRVIFQLEVILSDSETEIFHIDFTSEKPRFVHGYSPLANSFSYITANGLDSLMDGSATWDRLVHGGVYRTHSSVHMVHEGEIRVPKPPAIFDPLWDVFPFVMLENARIERDMAASA